jgi:hypothetical protein
MCVVAINIRHIAEAQDIKLFLAAAAGRIDRKQDRPCHAASHERDEAQKLDVPKEQKTIERLMLQDELVPDFLVRLHPAKDT